MHKFLRAVGFSKITKEELNDIFQKIIERPMLQKVAEDSEGNEFAELSIEFGDFFGLSLRGTFNENDSFEMSYYYPYFCGNKISTTEQIDIEKHAEKESYAGICDEVRLGVTLIFYLQNVADYLAVKNNKFYMSQANGTVLAALSTEGKILLPINKDEHKQKLTEQTMTSHGIRTYQDRISLTLMMKKVRDISHMRSSHLLELTVWYLHSYVLLMMRRTLVQRKNRT